MKKLLAVAAAAALLLGGCSEAPPKTTEIPANPGAQLDEWSEVQVIPVKVGERTVICVVLKGYRESALSCDWANAK